MESIRARKQEYEITLQNKVALYTGENEDSVDILNEYLTTVIAVTSSCRKSSVGKKPET